MGGRLGFPTASFGRKRFPCAVDHENQRWNKTARRVMLDKVNWTDVKRKGVRQRGKLVSWIKDAVMTDIENKVRAATSVEPYGPTQRELAEVASATHNAEEYPLIMGIIWSRLNDRGRYWRRVYKALDLLRYLILHGSPRVLEEARAALPHLEVLQDFRYFDQNERRDCGMSVRQKAKLVVEIIRDPRRYEEELQRSLTMMQKMSASVGSSPLYPSLGSAAPTAMSFDPAGYRGGGTGVAGGSHSYAVAAGSASWAGQPYGRAQNASFRGFGAGDTGAEVESVATFDASRGALGTTSAPRGPSQVDDLLGFHDEDTAVASRHEESEIGSIGGATVTGLDTETSRKDWSDFVTAASGPAAAQRGGAAAAASEPSTVGTGSADLPGSEDDDFFQKIQSSVMVAKPTASNATTRGYEANTKAWNLTTSTNASQAAVSARVMKAKDATDRSAPEGKHLLDDLLSGSLSANTVKNPPANGERSALAPQRSPNVGSASNKSRSGLDTGESDTGMTTDDPFSKLLTEMSLKDASDHTSARGAFTR
ncbi:hypothetical protein CCYA_CCYA02G0662 [Cyanidiococcus yangmingshanensis]|nr:hypothetical protein CCYA_CCYA02G0662 [Cyanidiococcus yangmingshanensis]